MNNELPLSLHRLAGTVGLWTMSFETVPASECAQIAREIESFGFSAVWIPEAWGREAFSSASLLLAGTSTLTIATGIANIWGRDAVAAAAASRTLNAAYHDRFVLGLGVSHQPLVERLRGHEYDTPLVAMTNYLAAMDAAPMFAPEASQPYGRVIAALGPKMLALAATAAHGAHPYLVTPQHTAIARAAMGDKFVGVEQAVVLGEDRDEFLKRAHAHLDIYTGLENYRNSWKRLGFDEADFVRGGSDRLCDALVVHGDEEAVLNRIEEHQQAGADHVCLQVLGAELTTVPLEEWRRLGVAIAS